VHPAPAVAAPGSDPIRQARGIVRALVQAHRESVTLARQLMLAQEFADHHEEQANQAIATAAAHPSDLDAVHAAIEAADHAEHANEDEVLASEAWAEHLMRVAELIAAVEQLPWLNSVHGAIGTADEPQLPPSR
jgi:hypothetical protein